MAHGTVRASHACGEMRGSKLAQSKWSDASRLLPVSLRQQFRLPSSATLTYIGSQLLTKSEREDLARVFKKMDANGDGKLSKDEIKNGY